MDMLQMMGAKGDAIGWSAVHPISIKVTERHPSITQRPRRGDGVAHRGLLDIGGDDANLAKTSRYLGQGQNAGAVDAVVVADQNSPLHLLRNACQSSFGRILCGRIF